MPVPCGIRRLYRTLSPAKGIGLLRITETCLTTKETSADLAEMTPQDFLLFYEPRARRRGGGVGLFVSSAHKFQQSVCRHEQVLRLYLANLKVVNYALLSSISIAHLVLLLLSSVSYKISCPTYLHSLMIWL